MLTYEIRQDGKKISIKIYTGTRYITVIRVKYVLLYLTLMGLTIERFTRFVGSLFNKNQPSHVIIESLISSNPILIL
jgi:hypothetical protein